MRIILFFALILNTAIAQKVTLTPISFTKDFKLKSAPTNNVLKGYTEFASSPFTKIPKGFTLSNSSTFYKFDTLNSSLFIKNREDVDSLYYYRDCEDGKFCYEIFNYGSLTNSGYLSGNEKNKAAYIGNNEFKWRQGLTGCCDGMPKSDTSALFYKNEFVTFPDFISANKNLSYSIIQNNFVTNREYRDFVNYTIDSISREILAEENPLKFYENYDEKLGKRNRLNYKIVYSKEDPQLKPALSQMYFPDHEKLNFWKVIDNRKIAFRTFDSEKNYQYTSIYPDTISWIWLNKDTSSSGYSIWASQNYFNKREFENMPVQGVNYWQAKAYLDWKTKFHNQDLIRQKSKCQVLYTFPLPEEIIANNISNIKTQKVDFEKYLITNSEYELFVNYVVDSMVLKCKMYDCPNRSCDFIHERLAIQTYYDDGELRDISDWRNNEKWYSNYYQKSKSELQKDSLFETFSQLFVPEYTIEHLQYDGFDTRKFFFKYYWVYYDKDSLFQNRNLNLSDFQFESHVYSFADRSEFIIREDINIFPGYNVKKMNWKEGREAERKVSYYYKEREKNREMGKFPDSLLDYSDNYIGNTMKWEFDSITEYKHKFYDFKSAPNEQIKAITYEQAKAYYHWKNEVPYIPTKEEWKLIQQGINPYTETELEVPGPFFRYVIRVYPVRED